MLELRETMVMSERGETVMDQELFRDNALLMIIDIQTRLVPVMSHGQKAIDGTQVLIKTSEALGMPVVVTEQYTKGLGNTVEMLMPSHSDYAVFEKNTFSGCTPEVLDFLMNAGRKQIVLVGMETHVCVYQTARALIKNGYAVFVPMDAVCSRTKENYMNGLELMRSSGAVITNVETVFFDLLKEAGTEEFRQLRKLIK